MMRKGKVFKTCMALLLSLTLCVPGVPYTGTVQMAGTVQTVEAATTTGTTADGLEYTVDTENKCVTITDYTGEATEVVIPAEIEGYAVTSIGYEAFGWCTSLTSIAIPDSVTRIEGGAFRNCTNLTNITISDSVTSIGNYAFCGCTSLTSITIPDSVTSIGNDVFYYCTSLTSVTIPDSVTSIWYEAFAHCTSLTSVTIPDSVTSIGDSAFEDCTGLISITIPDSVTSIGASAFDGCTGLISITIPDSVTYIGSSVFTYCRALTGVTIPDSVTSIGSYAFRGCSSLTSIAIPDSVTSIGSYAFDDCTSLTSVTFEGVQPPSLETPIFDICEAKTIYVPTASLSAYEEALAAYLQKGATIVANFPVAQPTYKPVDDVDLPTTTDSGTIELFDDVSGSAGNASIAQFFPGNYKLSFPGVGVKMEKKSEDDGTYTIKIGIGTKDSVFSPGGKTWEKYKEEFETAKRKTGRLDALLSAFGAKSGSFTITKELKAKPEMNVIGYYEAKYDENGTLISDEGGILVEFKWKASTTKQCMTAPIPIPYYIELGGSLNAKGAFTVENLITGEDMQITGKVEPSVEFSVGAGVGVSGIATLGVEGKGGLKVKLALAANSGFSSTGNLEGSVSIKAKIIFLFDGEYTLAKVTIPLWDTTKARTSMYLASSVLAEEDAYIVTTDEELALTDRSYQENTSEWNGTMASAFSARMASDLTMQELQSYVLPGTIPQMMKVGDDTVLVFQSNNAGRDTLNSVELVYSVYDGSGWSEPQPVSEEETLDTYFDMKEIGGDLYVAWQKCSGTITGDDTESQLAAIAEKSEIYVSKYDPDTMSFTSGTFVTNNASPDILPKLVDKDGTPAIMWQQLNDTNLLNSTGEKKIMVSELSEDGWTSETQVASTSAYITELAGTYTDGAYKAAYIALDDDDQTQLYLTDASGETLLSGTDDVNLSNLVFDKDTLTYVADGEIQSYVVSEQTTSTVSCADGSPVGATVQKVTSGEKTALIWMENEDDGCTFYSSVETEDGYSAPVELYTVEAVNGSAFTAALDEDGSWQIVLCAEDQEKEEKSSLIFISKEETPKIELESILINGSEAEDGEQPISYVVKNDSEETISQYVLTITAQDGSVVEKTVDCNLAPGESAYMEDTYETDCTESSDAVSVQVFADGQTDTEDTSLSQDVDYGNLQISDVKKTIWEDFVCFEATVTNSGQTAADGTVTLYNAAEDGTAVVSGQFASLAAGESETITLDYPVSEIPFDADGVSYLRINVDGAAEEELETDNTYYGVVYTWELPGADTTEEPTAKPTAAPSTVPENTPDAPQSVLYGDVNEDTSVTASDALTVLRAVVKLTSLSDTQMVAADVNGDGKVEAADALLILQKVVKLINTFPVETAGM